MKIGVVGDIHWSKYSSIVRSRGEKYSTRLENCIKSVNWAEKLIEDCSCDLTVYLGDFFDKCDLSAEELTALNDINWNKTPHKFIVGNHEMGLNDLVISSAHVFNMFNDVIDKPTCETVNDIDLFFLPYILEENRQSLSNYVPNKNCIVFSHNDIKGIQMGPIVSPLGFEIEDIENNCVLFLNGHLHNGSKISNKIINVGNLTGQNFSEDATKYPHSIIILDTNDMSCAVYDNPYALNFIKVDSLENPIIDSAAFLIQCLNDIPNIVCTVKINESEKQEYENILNDSNVIAHRLIVQPDIKHSSDNIEALESLSINHLDKFKEYILKELGSSEGVVEELSYITK